MKILGIDPGLASTGVGVILVTRDNAHRFLHAGYITTSERQPLPDRLSKIHDLIAGAIERHRPDVVAVESVFFARNVRSAVLMAHGRGAALLAAAQSSLPIHEYSPLEIKQSVVGKGRASKEQVQKMITLLLNLPSPPSSDHESDALACALCHSMRSKWVEMKEIKLKKNEKSVSAEGSRLEERRELLLRVRKGSRRRRRS